MSGLFGFPRLFIVSRFSRISVFHQFFIESVRPSNHLRASACPATCLSFITRAHVFVERSLHLWSCPQTLSCTLMIFLRMICSSLVRSSLLIRPLLASGSMTHSQLFRSLLAHTPRSPFHSSIRPVRQHSVTSLASGVGALVQSLRHAPCDGVVTHECSFRTGVHFLSSSLALSLSHRACVPFFFSLTHVPPPCSQPADQNLYSSLAESSTFMRTLGSAYLFGRKPVEPFLLLNLCYFRLAVIT